MPTICLAGHRFYRHFQGGVELQTKYIGEALRQAGWCVTYLAPSYQGRSGPEEIDQHLRVWWFPAFSFAFQTPLRFVREALDAIAPDVIYQRGAAVLTGTGCALRYARRRSIPYVFGFSSDRDGERFLCLKQNLQRRTSLIKRALLVPYSLWLDHSRQWIHSNADHLVAQHEGQANETRRKLARAVEVLPTIHQELNRPVGKAQRKIVLWVTNYRPWKRAELFVKLAARCKDMDCDFIMVYGRTKDEYIRPALEKAERMPNIRAQGNTPPDEVEKLMEDAALFVNTSTGNREGFPNTFVQCWLRETPTLSLEFDPGGVIGREQLGACSGNFEQLVRDVRHLLKDDEIRRRIGRRARAYAEQAHGFQNNAPRIADFFAGVVNGS